MKNLKKKLNHRKFGVLFGVLLPILSLLVLWIVRFEDKPFRLFIHFLTINSKARDSVLILSLIPSLLTFYFVNFRWNWERFSMGFVSLTVVFAVLFTIVMLVL